jgi:hypothetical protein
MQNLLSLAISLSLIAGSAIPQAAATSSPMPKEMLVKLSSLIVTGKVIVTRLEKVERDKKSTIRHYMSVVRLKTVTQGSKKPGERIELGWSQKIWKRGVSRPRCDTPHPTFLPCEQVTVHLSGGNRGAPYRLVDWSGKRRIKDSGKLGKLPKRKGGQTRCKPIGNLNHRREQ